MSKYELLKNRNIIDISKLNMWTIPPTKKNKNLFYFHLNRNNKKMTNSKILISIKISKNNSSEIYHPSIHTPTLNSSKKQKTSNQAFIKIIIIIKLLILLNEEKSTYVN